MINVRDVVRRFSELDQSDWDLMELKISDPNGKLYIRLDGKRGLGSFTLWNTGYLDIEIADSQSDEPVAVKNYQNILTSEALVAVWDYWFEELRGIEHGS